MANVLNSNLLSNTEGIQNIKGALVFLVKTEWNSAIVDRLEDGCKKILTEHGACFKTIIVPGAIEIPFAIKQCADSADTPHAFIALGCIIRGGTPHFEYVCQSVTMAVTQLNLTLPVPVIFGVLTVENLEQANERIGGVHGHKGEEAAITALKMIALQRQIKEGELK